MPLGFSNSTVTIEQLENITNVTNYPELAINVNMDIYGGYLYIILLFTLWIILVIIAYKRSLNEDILVNIMTSGAIVSIISFLIRAIYIIDQGVVKGLLTDFQLWIFPLLTLVVAGIIWATKGR